MAKEIEAKFININKSALISKLEALGAVKVFDEKLLRRCNYNLPIPKDGCWARVRDEVDKITMAYKCVTSDTIQGLEEIELVINDFENARNFLKAVGFSEKSYQESKRVRYVLKQSQLEFDIDTWPGLEPFLEIEADSEEKVRDVSSRLGLDWDTAIFGAVDAIYVKLFNITSEWITQQCPKLAFDEIPLELSDSNRRK